MQSSERTLDADGFSLPTRWYEPDEPCGAVVIAGAMGVPQRYYQSFASWLATEGFRVVTFDYRGMGEARPASLRGFETDIDRWIESDCRAVLDAMDAESATLPINWIGHSLGGQIAALVPGHERITQMITIATGSGYWLENRWQLRIRVWLLWFFVVPFIMPLVGYFPGRRLRMVGDLPSGVMKQWRRWCLHRQYVVGVKTGAREKFERVTMPVLSLAFTDDEYMSKKNTESMHSFYRNAEVTMRRITPTEAGVKRIGHFGFFRKGFESVWKKLVLPALRRV